MVQKLKKYAFPIGAFALTLITALFWVALRINHSGISKFLGADTNPSFLVMNLPVMVCVAAWIGVGLALLGLVCWQRRRWPAITAMVIGAVMLIAALVVIQFGAYDYLRFILPHFLKSLLAAAGVISFALLLFFPPRWNNLIKGIVVAAVVITVVILGYRLKPCEFSYGAVVYAVEDEYQIVFSTSDSAICWVEVEGVRYYDLYAGSMKSVDGVHKVEIPQSVLDAAGGYTICAKQMIYRGPFGGYTGETICQSYEFRPVDTADGLNYFTLSDVHEAVEPAVAAAGAAGELDFLVLLGDLVSMVETEADAQLANELAHRITGGEIPVIYARGNHEIKGEYSEVFYKYVGARGEDFYYTVTLGEDIFMVVLDMGEDHEDDWWEYYGTAQFDLYRQEQTQMLEQILADGEYRHYRYRMALCHIPIVYVDADGRFGTFRQEWTALLNEMDLDISLSGHEHRIYQFLPGAVEPGSTLVYSDAYSGETGLEEGGSLTDFNFPTFLAGRRSLQQLGGTQKYGYTEYLGLKTSVDFAAGVQICAYLNSEGETVTLCSAFEGNLSYVDALSVNTPLKRREK